MTAGHIIISWALGVHFSTDNKIICDISILQCHTIHEQQQFHSNDIPGTGNASPSPCAAIAVRSSSHFGHGPQSRSFQKIFFRCLQICMCLGQSQEALATQESRAGFQNEPATGIQQIAQAQLQQLHA